MPKMTFIWDDENQAHIAGRGVSPAEAERVAQDNRSRPISSNSSHRPGVIGRTQSGRLLVVIDDQYQERPLTVRVVTAYEPPS